jgi:hypothetical protein
MNFQDTSKLKSLVSVRIKTVAKGKQHLSSRLSFNVLADRFRRNVASRTHIIASGPQTGKTALELREFIPELVSRCAFEAVHHLIRSYRWGKGGEQMNMVRPDNQLDDFTLQVLSELVDQFNQTVANLTNQDGSPVLGAKNKVIVDLINRVSYFVYCHKTNYILVLCNTSNSKGGNAPLPTPINRGIPWRRLYGLVGALTAALFGAVGGMLYVTAFYSANNEVRSSTRWAKFRY